MYMSVVDAGGDLEAHVRMDGAFIVSINIAINEAVHLDLLRDGDEGAGAPRPVRCRALRP